METHDGHGHNGVKYGRSVRTLNEGCILCTRIGGDAAAELERTGHICRLPKTPAMDVLKAEIARKRKQLDKAQVVVRALPSRP